MKNNNNNHYIFLGPPGVGKGTLANLFSQKHNLIHVSTGDIFRQAINSKSDLGKQVEAIVKSGDYVPDNVTNALVKNTLKSLAKGFILDGYPRTLNQAKFLEQEKILINYAILLTAPMEIILNRLLGRKRSDDNPEIIKERIEIYNQKTKPLIDYYQAKGNLIKIDVSGEIEDNYNHLIKALTQRNQ